MEPRRACFRGNCGQGYGIPLGRGRLYACYRRGSDCQKWREGGIGIDPNIVSQPLYIAQQMYTMSAIETIEKYETRAIVEEVQFETTAGAGNMIPKVRLIYNGE